MVTLTREADGTLTVKGLTEDQVEALVAYGVEELLAATTADVRMAVSDALAELKEDEALVLEPA